LRDARGRCLFANHTGPSPSIFKQEESYWQDEKEQDPRQEGGYGSGHRSRNAWRPRIMANVRVVLFGATGMIGGGALLECLADNRVDAVLAVGRSSSGVSHLKLSELHHENFLDFEPVRARLSGYD